MTNISVVVILYNSRLSDSETLQSILSANLLHSTALTINIWNNGPQKFNNEDIRLFLEKAKKNISINLRQDCRNIALSKVYNYFLSQVGYDFFTIFDQDTKIDINFFDNLMNYKHLDVIFPLVYSIKDNCIIFPRYADQYNIVGTKAFEEEGKQDMDKVFTINSGLTLTPSGQSVLEKIKYPIFNENFAFYGIDTELFFYIREYCKQRGGIKAGCHGRIIHSLSSLEEEEFVVKQKRKLEEHYAVALEQIYLYKKNRWRLCKKVFRSMLKKKMTMIDSYRVIKCILFKQHPRCKFSIK